MVEIKHITAGYSGRTVLKDVSLSLPAGQVTVLLGPNGCGKSTLLKVLCGILPAEAGEILRKGENLLTLPPRKLAQTVAYLSQSRQVPDITAERLVLHGRFPYLGFPRRYRPEDIACARAAMEKMGISDLAASPVETLSGGQRQKVYLAMILAQDTPVVVLDEPTTYLDISHQLQLMQMARELARQGRTVLMVIHDLPHAFQTADQLVLMGHGTVAAAGTPEEIYRSGRISQVFGVTLHRAQTPSGWRYYCQEQAL